jgi:rhodanese-related sulfurtransferase
MTENSQFTKKMIHVNRHLVAGMVFVCFYAGAATAQNSATSSVRPLTVPEALRDIQPAGQSCRRDDAINNSNKQIERNQIGSMPDLSCSISAQELHLWLQAKDMTVIDTRHANDFSLNRIENAINVPNQDVRYKNQWRQKNITLVGSGKHDRELFSLCTTLKTLGYKSVKVLQGGMLSWQLGGLSIMGRATPLDTLSALDASQLLTEAQFNANLIVLSASRSDMQSHFKEAIVATSDDIESVMDALEQRKKQRSNEVLNSVVWIAPVNSKTEAVNRLQAKLLALQKPMPLFTYSESTSNFQIFMQQQQAMWVAQARGPKQPACGV